MEYQLITDHKSIDKDKWDLFVRNHPDGNIFQTSSFYYFIDGISQYRPFVVCAINDRKEIGGLVVGLLQMETGIKSYFSRRAIIYGGPLLADNNPGLLSDILKNLRFEFRRKAIYIEFRNLKDLAKFKPDFENQGFTFVPHLNYLVSLQDNDSVWKNLSKSRIRQIKKAEKNGVAYRVAENIQEVHQFYNLLSDLYKTRIKKPLPPVEFFESFYTRGIGIYLLTYVNGTMIGGMMCPIDRNTIYEWYVCGLDKEYEDFYPSVYVTYSAIDYGLKHQLKYFDFMGAGSPDKDYGVREFKARFGGELVGFGRYRAIMNKPLYFLGESAIKLLKRFISI
jgi:serine/alanine adding enzyme